MKYYLDINPNYIKISGTKVSFGADYRPDIEQFVHLLRANNVTLLFAQIAP